MLSSEKYSLLTLITGAVLITVGLLLLPGAWMVQNAEDKLVIEKLREIQQLNASWASNFDHWLSNSKKSVRRFATLVSNIPESGSPDSIPVFDSTIIPNQDGSFRSDRALFSPFSEAGVWIPGGEPLGPGIKHFFIQAKQVTENFGQGALSNFENTWIFPKYGGIIIFWPNEPEWIYDVTSDMDYTASPWVTLTRPDRNPAALPRFTNTTYDPATDSWMISIVAPYYRNEEWSGAVGHDFPISGLVRQMDALKLHRETNQMLIKRDGTLLISDQFSEQIQSSQGHFSIADTHNDFLKKFFSKNAENSDDLMSFPNNISRNGKQIYMISHVKEADCFFITITSEDALLTIVRHSYRALWILGGISLFFLTLIPAIIISRVVLPPVKQLMSGIKKVTEGQLDYRFAHAGSKEFCYISKALDHMVQQIFFSMEENKRKEASLREKDKLLHDIGKMVKVGAWKYEIKTGKGTWTNEVSRIHDLEQNQTLNVEEGLGFYHGEHRKKIEHAFNELVKKGVPYDLELELVSAKGVRKWVRVTGDPVMGDGGVLQLQGAVQDITERKRMEELMIQNEKMLSVGGLAAGMAHEINNPMAGMLQTAQVIAQRLRTDSDIPANLKAAKAAGTTMESIEKYMEARGIQRMIEAITESGQRISEIVTNMLNFARKEDAAVSSHHLNKILDKTIELAATDFDLKKEYDFKQIKIVRKYKDDMPAVPCQAGKIQQVLLNVLTNGTQAMQSTGTLNPRFLIRTNVDLNKDMACVEIEDNGPGMDETTRKKIFDPFFTTKPVGMGTGLGLSVSYFIITENHKGEMTVESSPGAGTTFIIRLPLYTKSDQD